MTAGPYRMIQAHANHGVAWVDDELKRIHFPRRIGRPLPGDLVHLDQAGTLVSIVKRRNLFGRGDARGRFRPIAANLDRALIIIAPQPAPSRDLIHRYLAAALILGVEPLIGVNKSDLPCPDQPPFSELGLLTELGFTVVSSCSKLHNGIEALEAHVRQGVTLFAGQSGVGKSSLLNALIPDLAIQTGQLSRVTGKGTHTTTTATAHRYSENTWLIDSPGVWEYGLWKMEPEKLALGFPEFAGHAAHCRFRNCRHQTEPGCAVRRAVESNKVPVCRHQAWLRLLAEQDRLGA